MLEAKSYPGTRHLVLLDADLLKKREQNVFFISVFSVHLRSILKLSGGWKVI